MKRPIVIVAMVYVAGLAVGPLLRLPPTASLAAIALIAASQLVLLATKRAAMDGLLFAAVFLIGDYRQQVIESENRTAREQAVRLEKLPVARIEGRLASTERTYPTRRTYRLEDCVVRGGDAGAGVRFPTAIQLVCSGAAFEEVRDAPPLPGDRVMVEGRLARPPDLSNPDVFNYSAYLENKGIGASVFARQAGAVTFSPPRIRSPRDWIVALAEGMRRWVEATLDGALEPEVAALNRSIFLGEAEWLDRGVREDFMRCGLAHIFAVSGLNVVLLVWVLHTFIRLFRLSPKWRAGILIAATAVFSAVVGFPPSVVRATIMLAAWLVLPFLRYRVEPLTGLATAALVILAANPRALWQPGFQFSFLCMLSIILLQPSLADWLRVTNASQRSIVAGSADMRRRLEALAVVLVRRHIKPDSEMVLAAQLGVLPLLAHYFHMIPFLGAASNIVAALLVWAIMAVTVFLLGTTALLPAIATVFGNTLNLLSHLLLWLVREFALLPAAAIPMPVWPIFVSGLYYLILFGWAAMPREPSPFFEAKQRARLWLALAAIAAWVVWAPAVLGGGSGNTLRATFFDVGQGDSCLLELPGGPVVLVDGGETSAHAGERIIAPFLEARGLDRLDAVVATHSDSDHIGGLPEVFGELTVGWLIEGPTQSDSQAYRRLVGAAEREPARRETVFAGDWIEAPMGARLLFLHPPRGAAYSNSNNQSLVLMADWRECEILIAGDVERAAERDLLASGADLACDVFKVSHHGSALATSEAFLERARPRLAVISCGRNNPYGHPAPEVVERLTSAGITVARTDRDGAVTVRSDGRSLEWRTEGKSGGEGHE
jgi:competence protein ComEC